MNFFSQMRIGARLMVGFGLLIAAGLFMAAFGRFQLGSAAAEVRRLNDDRFAKILLLTQINDNISTIALSARNVIMTTDEAVMKAEKKQIDDLTNANGELLTKLEASIATDEGKKLMAQISAARPPYRASLDKVMTLGMANKNAEAQVVLLGETTKLQRTYFEAIDSLTKFQAELMHASVGEVESDTSRAGIVLMAAAAISTLLGSAVAWSLTRSITGPLAQAVGLAQAVAQGDLTRRIDKRSNDETGQLLDALQLMTGKLAGMVGEVRSSSDSIATGSAQIATGNSDLSQRTEEQAANLQQTVASMEQLAATVGQSADTAQAASQLANAASHVAAEGGEVMSRVVTTMNDITASSRKIADIISVIDGIAFQTNILALNAAVEAARAGEQGRGFAVVASEVRSLAQRSAEAAKEIKTLIGQSVEKVDAGSKLVGAAGATMDSIVSQVNRVTDLIGEISAAAVEQKQGIGQVTEAAGQLDQVTQQNAALVEESAAAADSLRQQAARLSEVVSVFKL